MSANNLVSLGYSFSGMMLVDKFKADRDNNYFQIYSYTLPTFERFTGEDVKYKGIPTNQISGNYSLSNFELDVFLTSNYYEYKSLTSWLLECRQHREYLHKIPDLLSDISIYIMDTKLEKIAFGLRFKKAFPMSVNSFKYQKTINPLRLTFNFKYLDVEFIPEEQWSTIDVSQI